MSPAELIVKEDVEIALATDKGKDAVLHNFYIENFLSKGESYAAFATRVVVDYTVDGSEHRTSYVAKTNPCRPPVFKEVSEVLFRKEIGFYSQILPLLNDELKRINEPYLKMPRYFHSVSEPSKEVLYLEDLRREGFSMHNPKKILDNDHIELLLRELARFHAASTLLLSRNDFTAEHLLENFPCLEDYEEQIEREGSELTFDKALPYLFECGALIADRMKKYGDLAKKIRAMVNNVGELFKAQYTSKPEFQTLIHTDFWNNNFLFR